MLHKASALFTRLMDAISGIPVVDCHEHLHGPQRDLVNAPSDPFLRLVNAYIGSDLWSASSNREMAVLQSSTATFEQKWEVFSRLWPAVQNTAYARATKIAFEQTYGVEISSRAGLLSAQQQIKNQTEADYLGMMDRAGIKAVITDVLLSPPWEDTVRFYRNPYLRDFLEGRFPLPAGWRHVFNANFFHELRRIDYINFTGNLAQTSIASLSDYEEAVFKILKRAVQQGVIGMKDWSAYHREISFDLPPRCDAERLFNQVLIDPRNQLSYPSAKPLDDYLFHQMIRFAQELNLPVQVHTGHMAGIRQRVDKANARNFVPVLELYPQVRFDLFHGNWPYMEDILFIGKNYPNASIDLCWAIIIDPLYCVEFLKRSILTIPHVKIHAFGGDYFLTPEMSVAQLLLTREVIASALADVVEWGWLDEEAAVGIAGDWLYNNPNRFYHLGLPDWQVE